MTPAPPGSQAGNRITAKRWAGIFRQLGYDAPILTEYRDEPCDLLVALHAVKSAPSVERFAGRGPVVLVIGGTDLDPNEPPSEPARRSIGLADRVVFLRQPSPFELGWLHDEDVIAKHRVIYQSAVPPEVRREPDGQAFEVCVLGHLRPVKDPFRAARAARLLPALSRVRVLQVGAALSAEMEAQARVEAAENPRYRWYGELPHAEALHLLSGCRVLVLSSLNEGGPSAVSEALACGVPILSTPLPAVIGLLGPGYLGFFPFADTHALAVLLWECETKPYVLNRLTDRCAERRELISPDHETAAWRALFDGLW